MGFNHNIYISITEVSSTGFRVNGSITLGQNSSNASGFQVNTDVDGFSTRYHTVYINRKGGSASWSDYYSVGQSYDSRTYACSVWADLSWSSNGSNTGNPVRTTATVPATARPTHTVSYNANGGTGAPANQTKTYGYILTLSSTVPTRVGYTFVGWGTSASDTGVKYSPGGKYGDDADITLYAIWTQIDTCTITYDANGGSGAPTSQTHVKNTTSQISVEIPTRSKYAFLGWSTSSSATSPTYISGGQYTNNSFSNGATITLYAVWARLYLLYVSVPDGKCVESVYVNVPSGSLKGLYVQTS